MSVTRPVVKTETLKKTKANQPGYSSISLPLESGQLERWYFLLGASNGISVGDRARGKWRGRRATRNPSQPGYLGFSFEALFFFNFFGCSLLWSGSI